MAQRHARRSAEQGAFLSGQAITLILTGPDTELHERHLPRSGRAAWTGLCRSEWDLNQRPFLGSGWPASNNREWVFAAATRRSQSDRFWPLGVPIAFPKRAASGSHGFPVSPSSPGSFGKMHLGTRTPLMTGSAIGGAPSYHWFLIGKAPALRKGACFRPTGSAIIGRPRLTRLRKADVALSYPISAVASVARN